MLGASLLHLEPSDRQVERPPALAVGLDDLGRERSLLYDRAVRQPDVLDDAEP